jgi:Domain of unknown function (DU1801)
MVTSAPTNPDEYVAQLPDDRREVIAAMRKFVRKHLPRGYVESVSYGMLCWGIPLEQYPDTYNGQPLGYVALAAQKNYYALYVPTYMDPQKDAEFREEFEAAGKKLDMGKCCVRFRKIDDLALDAVGKMIASTPPKRHIEIYEASRANTKSAKKPAKKRK